MTRSETVKFLALRSIGNFLVLFAIFGVFATFGPAMVAEATYRIAQVRGVNYRIEDTSENSFGALTGEASAKEQAQIEPTPVAQAPGEPTLGSVISGPKEQILIPKDPNFSIIIPKIGASARIYPNVDPTNDAEFLPLLQDGIAHAKGTVFPGMNGNVYLFAHSTDNWWNVGRYNAIFYLLKDINVDDEIAIFFEGRRYNYIVTEKRVVDPSDVSSLVDSHGGPQQLVLQTCWPPGTTWQRLLVMARLKSDLP